MSLLAFFPPKDEGSEDWSESFGASGSQFFSRFAVAVTLMADTGERARDQDHFCGREKKKISFWKGVVGTEGDTSAAYLGTRRKNEQGVER